MERADRAPVATFYAPAAWSERVELGEAAAHHAAVKRLAVGDVLRLTNGRGQRALGTIDELSKKRLSVALDSASAEASVSPPRVDLWAPIGDRERMLTLAEKSVELGASAWMPVMYARSRSVTPRGEGEAFQQKVRLRQVNALEQCAGAWLPEMMEERSLEDALLADRAVQGGVRLLLDPGGEPMRTVALELETPVRIALGPEGGLNEAERAHFVQSGWRPVSLGGNILRFETAAIAALAIVRSHLP